MHVYSDRHGQSSQSKCLIFISKSKGGHTFESGAEMTPSFSLGVPITSAQYLWIVASQALFHIYIIGQHKAFISDIYVSTVNNIFNKNYQNNGIVNHNIRILDRMAHTKFSKLLFNLKSK